MYTTYKRAIIIERHEMMVMLLQNVGNEIYFNLHIVLFSLIKWVGKVYKIRKIFIVNISPQKNWKKYRQTTIDSEDVLK